MFRLLVLKGDTEVYFNTEDKDTPIEGNVTKYLIRIQYSLSTDLHELLPGLKTNNECDMYATTIFGGSDTCFISPSYTTSIRYFYKSEGRENCKDC